jgi:hypothetical protein
MRQVRFAADDQLTCAWLTSVEEVDGYQLGDISLTQMRPNSHELGAIFRA